MKPGAHNRAESNWFGTPAEVSHSRDYNENNGLPELRKTLAERLAAAGVVACPGEFFGMPGHLRLGWGVARPKLEAALAAVLA